jgi:hypothetical protein
MAEPTQANEAEVVLSSDEKHLTVKKISVAPGGTFTWKIKNVRGVEWKATKAWACFDSEVAAVKFAPLEDGTGDIIITVPKECKTGTYPYSIYCNRVYDPAREGDDVERGIMAEGNSHPVMIVTNTSL